MHARPCPEIRQRCNGQDWRAPCLLPATHLSRALKTAALPGQAGGAGVDTRRGRGGASAALRRSSLPACLPPSQLLPGKEAKVKVVPLLAMAAPPAPVFVALSAAASRAGERLDKKLQRYFQSRHSGGGECEVAVEDLERGVYRVDFQSEEGKVGGGGRGRRVREKRLSAKGGERGPRQSSEEENESFWKQELKPNLGLAARPFSHS